MREFTVPAQVPATTEGNLSDLPRRNAARSGGRVVIRRRDEAAPDGWRDVSATTFADDVTALARGFVAAGVTPGQSVAIMCRTRYEWTVLDFALWTAGAVVVPIYETSSAEQVQWILSDSGAVGIVVETAAHAARVESVRKDLPDVAHVWQVDDEGAASLSGLVAAGAEVSDEALEAQRTHADRTHTATIIYTSGTTGRPKGCVLTHGNFLDLTENTVSSLGAVVAVDGASTLLFLPLAHVFARFIEVLCIQSGAVLAHTADIKSLLDDFASYRPTFFLSVPRVFEKIYNSSEQKANADGKGRIFAIAAATAIAYSEALDTGRPSLGLRAKHAVFDRLVYSKLRGAMGGRIEYAVSGGAPLGTRLGHFYRGIGVTVLEGYGLTETTAPATVNTPSLTAIGTVGSPLPGVGVAIADDGEILLSGCNLFAGYHNQPDATAEAMRDGWFHTGDLGSLDDRGCLTITGRKKEILVTAGGKNVAPAVLEDRLRAHPLVSQCIVVGDQRPFVGALVTLDAEMWGVWSANNGLAGVDLEAARTNAAVLAELQTAVDGANDAVSKAESIRKFHVLPGDFTEDNGYLTPSLKLKRSVVMRDFAEAVDSLYDRV